MNDQQKSDRDIFEIIRKKWRHWYISLPIGIICFVAVFSMESNDPSGGGVIALVFDILAFLLIIAGIVDLVMSVIKSVKNIGKK